MDESGSEVIKSGSKIRNPEVAVDKSGSEESVATRHALIVEIMKKNGECRLRDLQEFFPEISDRALRYDLQRLTEDGFIEKIGQGPAVVYKTVI